MQRGSFLRTAGSAAVALGAAGRLAPAGAATKSIVIAEPVHSLGYLPLYVAIRNGYLTGYDVTMITLASSGAAHTNAVLSGQAWAFIGGPEHNAYADVKGAQLRAICNVVNRGNSYWVAAKGLTPGKDLKSFMRGKRIAVGGYGGTPNSILRYELKKLGLDPLKDVTLVEVATPAVPAVIAQGQADIGVMDEPMITKGVEAGAWGQPFFAGPHDLGAYAYSTINVTQKTIDADTEGVRTFVGGVKKGLAFVRDHRDETMALAAKDFPDLSPSVLKSALARAYGDEIWEWDGKITTASVKTAQSVVIAAGLLAAEVPYQEIIDPQFFK